MRDSKPQGIEAMAVRRAKIADADKVRYRVYSSPTEYVAVIAESALMAVKVAGVTAPHKIMRDLPTEGIAIEAKRMAAIEPVPERVMLGIERVSEKALLAEMPEKDQSNAPPFVAVGIADLRGKGSPRARILPPQLLAEIIEQHVKTHGVGTSSLPTPTEEVAPPAAPASEALLPEEAPSAQVAETQVSAPEITPEEHIIQAPRELTVEEKINQLADEIQLPAASPSIASAVKDAPVLSNDDVEKLLNAPE